jgi:predicted phage-related endonuclease
MPTPINISASRGAAILGLSDYQTPVQVWLQIMESRDPGFLGPP